MALVAKHKLAKGRQRAQRTLEGGSEASSSKGRWGNGRGFDATRPSRFLTFDGGCI